MKNLLFTGFLLLLLSALTNRGAVAQDNLYVYHDHEVTVIPIASIEKAAYSIEEMALIIYYDDTAASFPLIGIEKIVFEPLLSVDSQERATELIKTFKLFANFPNPFNPSTTISYQVSSPGEVEVKVFNLEGRLVTILVSERQNPGTYQVVWNGLDDLGRPVSTGMYYYQVSHNEVQQTKSMLLLH